MQNLLNEIRQCRHCNVSLPHGPRPIIRASSTAKIVIIGQAPGAKVHASGIAWDDASGDRLRDWLGMDKDSFYREDLLAIVPMGFCYPGRGRSGDLPPRPECAPLWHERVFAQMPYIQLRLLIGQYAQKQYLAARAAKTLTETVKNYAEYAPTDFPLPHPSPRNNIWQKKNPWFNEEVVPALRKRVQEILS